MLFFKNILNINKSYLWQDSRIHPPNRKNAKHISLSSKLGSGPQQREFQAEIHQAKQVGVGAQTSINFEQKFTKQSSWGRGPNKENSPEQNFAKASWGWGPNKENFEQISPSKALGLGPQQREFRAEFRQAKQVGVGAPTKRISSRISPSKASWLGPQQRGFEQNFAKQSKLGLRSFLLS